MRPVVTLSLSLLLAACSGDPAPSACADCDDAGGTADATTAEDLGRDAPAPRDNAPLDAGPRDAGLADTGPRDTGPRDTGVDTGPAPSNADPANRSQAEVCARWGQDRGLRSGLPPWTPGGTACGLGTLPEVTRLAALRLTNTFRWLAGLNPVVETPSDVTPTQACALMMERNGALSHTPPTSWTCYSPEGAQGAGSSNIVGGRGFAISPWYSVQSWIDDSRDITMTLGHRRWMLYPPLSAATYGQTSGFACLWVLRRAGATRNRPWVAWPNAGPVPLEAMTRIWSFSASGLGVSGANTVTVTQDATRLDVTAMQRQNGYGDDTISWQMPAIRAGSVYRVSIAGLRTGTVSYEVRPVACN
ncbi:MAG: CAP domain-containing protein [Myxococcales bacterium]|nr:CAP domain-containing protein [Myxococcales bacterium]